MYLETEVIVLKPVKYSDSKTIVQCFSRHHGQLSAFIQFSKKSRVNSYLYPCSILKLIATKHSNNGLYQTKELAPLKPGALNDTDPRKSLVRYFLAELLLKTTTKEFALPHLFDASIRQIQSMDKENCPIPLLPVRFLKMLSKQLGLEPDETVFSKDLLNYHNSLDNENNSFSSAEKTSYMEFMIKHLQDNFHFSDLQSYPVLKTVYE